MRNCKKNKIWELYVISNTINDKKYIGITSCGTHIRFLNHKSEARGKRKSVPLYNAMRKYGTDIFSVVILCKGSKEYIADLERKAITLYNTKFPFGYNLSEGGEFGGAGILGIFAPRAVFSKAEIDHIRTSDDKDNRYFADLYGVNISTILKIRNNTTYPDPAFVPVKYRSGPRKRKLTLEEVEEIRASGEDYHTLSLQYKVHCRTIYDIITNRTWNK